MVISDWKSCHISKWYKQHEYCYQKEKKSWLWEDAECEREFSQLNVIIMKAQIYTLLGGLGQKRSI